ncbi:MAG: thiol-disulfide oxidoreductase DCC family protein [Bacteroidia bacterium]
MIAEKQHGIILFDGVCNYCSGWVDFIMRHDKKDYFRFATLQSEIAKGLLAEKNISNNNLPDSVILIENEKIFFRSDAGLRIQQKLNFPFPILYSLIIVPRFIRDAVYNFIANNRYKWFGKKEICRVPVSEQEKNKFLS